MFFLAPSILSADFLNLKRDIDLTVNAGSKYIHIDVMDGHFVPNISIGPVVLQSIVKDRNAILDVHLMIQNPDQYLDEFIKEKPDFLTIHLEANGDTISQVKKIKDAGIKAGVSIKPKTSIDELDEVLPLLDMVLIMSVEPGFGGQGFIDGSLEKISALKKKISDRNLDILIEVDGGIKKNNIKDVALAGADILVAGSAVFLGDIEKNTRELIDAMNG